MSINLGIDFGTTYTIAAYLESFADGKYDPMTCDDQDSKAVINSIAVVDEAQRIYYGEVAKDYLQDPTVRSYRGFKMLIGDKNPALRKQKFYDDVITPEMLTQGFLKHVIELAVERMGKENEIIDNLVIGVPAAWSNKKQTVDCNLVLKKLIREMEDITVNNIEVVSEPTLACAYFADVYKKKNDNKKNFKGKMALIDYGGGTLDLSLCDVNEKGTGSVVTELATIGQGWNTQGELGAAGLSFMEQVTKNILEENGVEGAQNLSGAVFDKAVVDVEDRIKKQTKKEMSQLIDAATNNELSEENRQEALNTIVGTPFFYGSARLTIKIKHIIDAYKKVNEKVLENCLKEFEKICDKNGVDISVNNNNKELIKIILVGGFNQFYMTEKQIKEFFNARAGIDDRFNLFEEKGVTGKKVMENAIAYGAALIADKRIGFEYVMPYHIGLGSSELTADGNQTLKEAFYAIKMGEKIVFEEEYPICYPNKKEPLILQGRAISLFVRNWNEDISSPNQNMDIEFGMPKKFKDLVTLKRNDEKPGIYKFAISLDKSMIVTIHVYELARDGYNIDPNKVTNHFTLVLDEPNNLVGDLRAL